MPSSDPSQASRVLNKNRLGQTPEAIGSSGNQKKTSGEPIEFAIRQINFKA